jgi:Xaa-Pro aminopeptidase
MKKTSVHARRRTQLVHAMGRDSIAIIATSPTAFRNRDVEYPYRADSDFYYLTGFPEPESVAVITSENGRQGRFILFCRDRDREKEIWDGRRAGQAGAREFYGADESYSIGELDQRLPGLLENRRVVYYPMGRDPAFDQRLMGWRNQVRSRGRAGIRAPEHTVGIEEVLHEMRLRKDRSEIDVMRRAARISAAAHQRAMYACRPQMREYQIEAELLHEFARQGSRFPAYGSIVAGGANACILHYRENDAPLRDGDLLLIDAGCELDGYASDITRTFPVNGRFSPAQRRLYDVVLAAQLAAIECVKPGVRWNEPHDVAVKVLTAGLVKLGLLKGRPSELIKEGAYRRFYMHRTGHWLGMDVHDVGDYRADGEWRPLEPGMVLTVEPGLYVAPSSRGVDKQWWGIGIRIEDDVLVTAKGHEVLSRDAVKNADDIEAFMAQRNLAAGEVS